MALLGDPNAEIIRAEVVDSEAFRRTIQAQAPLLEADDAAVVFKRKMPRYDDVKTAFSSPAILGFPNMPWRYPSLRLSYLAFYRYGELHCFSESNRD